MKKTFKKLMAALLAVAMLCALAVPAFADDNAAATYTIKAPATNHQYEIYQIFTGDLSNNGVLSNIKWGVNGTGTTGEAVPEDVLTAINGVANGTDAEKLTVIKNYVELTSSPVATVSDGGTYTAAAGYYLIKDKDNTVSGTDAYTTYLVKVVGNVDITPKSNTVPSFEKKLKDTNDTTGVTSDWQDSADYDIGDSVPFQLKGTVPDSYDSYNKYYYAFHDVEETGLTFKRDTVKVYVNSVEITTGFEVVTSGLTDGCTFEVVFDDLKQIPAVQAGSVITVEYESELNNNATLGKPGNVNKAKLEFSNNPNNGGKGETGETPWDEVIVFTYKVVVNKVDPEDHALAGAEFTLTKKLNDGTTKDVAVVKNTAGTEFTFSGLDDGTYTLTETKTPDGYNTIAPIIFVVTAEHTIIWNNGAERNTILTSLTGDVTSGEITFTPNVTDGSLTTNVVNHAGATLPSTGGIGTTIFYVVGGGLMIAAAVLLITKKRMEGKN